VEAGDLVADPIQGLVDPGTTMVDPRLDGARKAPEAALAAGEGEEGTHIPPVPTTGTVAATASETAAAKAPPRARKGRGREVPEVIRTLLLTLRESTSLPRPWTTPTSST